MVPPGPVSNPNSFFGLWVSSPGSGEGITQQKGKVSDFTFQGLGKIVDTLKDRETGHTVLSHPCSFSRWSGP